MRRFVKNMADLTLRLQPRHLGELRRLIATHLPEEEVWVYGSRVAGAGHDTSDLDLVVRHPADLQAKQGSAFWDLKEAISDSNLPLLVELFDWARLPVGFLDNIAEQHVVLYVPGSLSHSPRMRSSNGDPEGRARGGVRDKATPPPGASPR